MMYTLEVSPSGAFVTITCEEHFALAEGGDSETLDHKLATFAKGVQMVNVNNYVACVHLTQFADLVDVKAKIVAAIAQHFGLDLDEMELVETPSQKEAREKKAAEADMQAAELTG